MSRLAFVSSVACLVAGAVIGASIAYANQPHMVSALELLQSARGELVRATVLNLLLNAQEAMPGGGTIRIETISDRQRGMSAFCIGDTGPGISEADQQALLNPLNSNHPERLGLGLYMCKSIIDQHGGDLQIRSTPGSGTNVIVWLPWYVTSHVEIDTAHS